MAELTARCVEAEADRIQDWVAAQFVDPTPGSLASRVAGALLACLLEVIPGEDITVTVARHPRMARIVITGPRVLPESAMSGPGWRMMRQLSTSGSVTPEWTGLWAEIPTALPPAVGDAPPLPSWAHRTADGAGY